MSHRRPDPRQAALEHTLRRALRLAADSIEPAADGLDRIRTKIVAAPPAQSVRYTGLAAWSSRYLTGVLAALSVVARHLEPAAIKIRYAYGAVAERFGPDLRRGGWIGWLRPAAALATGLLVVTGASWAIAGLPQVMQTANSSGTPTGSSSSSSSSSGHTGDGTPYGGGAPGGSYPVSPSGKGSPSCKASSASASPSGSSSTSTSPSSGPTSPTTSPTSPTATPTTSSPGSGSPSPTDSPTDTSSTGASGQATPGTQTGSDPASSPTVSAAAKPRPQISDPRTVKSPSPSPSPSGCG